MTYSLVLAERPLEGRAKDVGENVLLSDLTNEYKVFAFYYPSALGNPDLEDALRGLGDLTGKNLLVNLGRLDDPNFDRIIKLFNIKSYPVITVTATAQLASPPDEYLNAYVRLENDRLLSDPVRAVTLLQEVYSLFLAGDIARALSKVKWTQRSEGLRALAAAIVDGLRHLAGFVAERDIKVSVMEGRFELTKSGG